MNEAELDARLAALLRDEPPVPGSDIFADRIVALAAHDLSRRQWRRRTAGRIGRESLGLVAVLFAFIVLAGMAPESLGPGDFLPLSSPGMAGLVMLVLWSFVSLSPARR
jgi:hypothetical protein